MQIHSAEFVTSAAAPHQFLQRPIPHVVFAGRSNVGKSSLLNKLLNRKKLAKTSQTPGKTRLINYFLINDRFFFVDIPGYGYARVSQKEQRDWGRLIETYLTTTPFLAMVFLLLDIRREPAAHDREMIEWLQHHDFPFRIILTKADKLSRNKANRQQSQIARALATSRESLIATSAMSGAGLDHVWRQINEAFEQSKNREIKDTAL